MRIRTRQWPPQRTRKTRGPRATREGEPSPHVTAHITRLVVEVGNRADDWRSATVDAERAFRRWANAARTDRDDAAVAYLAATDREEQAAGEYRRAWEACCAAAP
jgi:hypothetical protein